MPNNYYPILKTTIAEMRALKKLDFVAWRNITPILELTKSRKSKNNQESCVYRKIDEIKEIVGDNEFILDLTNIESLSNEQIESFQSDRNGFENWCSFISEVRESNLNVIPMLIAYPDNTIDDLVLEMQQLCAITQKIAVRIPICEPDLDELFIILRQILCQNYAGIGYIIFDGGYIHDEIIDPLPLVNIISSFCSELPDSFSGKVVFASSSFPASAIERVSGNKFNNSFYLQTLPLFKRVVDGLRDNGVKKDIFFGDYACIHPNRNESKAYNWIPRIDYPTVDKIYFSRSRREEGGYIECAKMISSLSCFKNDSLQCWGMVEIRRTSAGSPGGKSPSYWISVRSNIHMSRMALING
ncbi:beta family protein [Escherichia coli]|uniref:beta family protein n=1 Tax=Escherichia coli TaxID=562 RepID=UPI0038B2982A